MILKIVSDSGKHYSLHEGPRIGIHPKGETWSDGCTIIVEGRGANSSDSLTIEVNHKPNKHTEIYIMNDCGKTVEHVSV